MWLIVFLVFLAPQLSQSHFCPSSCVCNANGAVMCSGAIKDIPPLSAGQTFSLNLNDTNIMSLNAQSFASLTFLKTLRISNSPLSIIHPKAFQGASQLRWLALTSNSISSLPQKLFNNLSNLTQLFISDNAIKLLDADTFNGLDSLTELDISKNRISKLDANVFKNLTNLIYLNLCENLLQSLPEFHSLTRLKSLILYSNNLETIKESSFDHLNNLLVLMLHKNKIRELSPKIFWHMPSLLTLTLSSNQLQSIPAESFYYLPNLTKLTLYNNPLISLPEQLVGNMPRLQEFYLHYTNLTTVPWNLFVNMTSLRFLNLHLNPMLNSLPKDLFCCLPNLQKLSLKNNNLQNVHPEQFSALNNLRMLRLNNNMLRSLSPGTFQHLQETLQEVTLGNNPWNCKCSILDFATWINENQKKVTDLGTVLCSEPAYLYKYPLTSLTHDNLHCGVTNATLNISVTEKSSPSPSYTEMTTMLTTPPMTPRTATTDQWKALSNVYTTHFFPTASPSHPSTPQATTPTHISNQFIYKRQNTDATISRPFYNTIVLENGPHIVHNSHHRSWTYLWTLPVNGKYSGFLMALHIVLLVISVLLIFASVYALHCLNRALWEIMPIMRIHKIVHEKYVETTYNY